METETSCNSITEIYWIAIKIGDIPNNAESFTVTQIKYQLIIDIETCVQIKAI